MNDTTVEQTPSTKTRRKPTQERSRSRVDAILNATQTLILKKGSAGLKIHELAEEAGITPSSIYQYFPNKRAILMELDKRYMNATFEILRERLTSVNTLQECFQQLGDALDDYYDWYRSEPVIADLWYGLAADKSMLDMELQSSRMSADIVLKTLYPLVDPEDHEDLKSSILLLSHLTGASIRLCTMANDEEALQIKNAYRHIIMTMGETLRPA